MINSTGVPRVLYNLYKIVVRKVFSKMSYQQVLYQSQQYHYNSYMITVMSFLSSKLCLNDYTIATIC